MTCPKCQAPIPDDASFCSECGMNTHMPDDESTRTMTSNLLDDPGAGMMLAGKYRIVEVAGRGGMGVVYKAEDIQLHRPVALKFLPPEKANHPESRDRFLLEARATAALSHPNICTIHEVNEQEHRPFIVMEYIEGQTLRERIRARRLDPAQAAEIGIQVAEALEQAHARGIVHRDIKSSNIMLTEPASGHAGQAKVMDFGLAKVKGESLHTRLGTTLGTVAYMSPEQASGQTVDHRTDIWSLGVVLYEMLSGQLPFTGERDTAILYAVVHNEPKAIDAVRRGVPAELCAIVDRALKKDPAERFGSAAQMSNDLRRYLESLEVAKLSVLTPKAVWRAIRMPKIAIPATIGLVLIGAAAGWFVHRQSRIRWARETAMPEIQRLTVSRSEIGFAHMSKAYKLAREAEQHIPADPRLAELLERCSATISITTEPPGATISMQEVPAVAGQWKYVGVSPVQKLRVPRGYSLWKLEKDGYEGVLAAGTTDVHRVLDSQGKIPPGMVRIAGAETDAGKLNDFFIDRYEVTNAQYKQFVDNGGYRDEKYWKHAFTKEGKRLSWGEAMAEFVDQTGRNGPATWHAGEYPKNQGNYPVSGVSWYEAAAYAEYSGKSLPTLNHWGLAAHDKASAGVQAWISYVSNFKGDGLAPVGSHPGISRYGAYDMPGNVREWCWNETRSGRIIRGGAWNDVPYMMIDITQAPVFDRSPKNGFRCALYPAPETRQSKAFGAFEVPARDYRRRTPVSDSIFQVYREQFAYDRQELNARVEWRDDSSKDWVQEKVAVDAAYGRERLPIYIFLPSHASPPYQTVLYFPGTGSADVASSRNLDRYWEFEQRLAFLLKTGRAVVYPVYKGTFERREDVLSRINTGAMTHQYSEYAAQLVKDVKRTVDYLETRPDIDGKRLAYLGFSWGGRMAPLVLATEERLRAAVLLVGGMRANVRPETDYLHYVARVRIPVLMLNGRYDMFFPFDMTVQPMFDLLATPPEHKRLRVYETDHFVPNNEYVKETLDWLDRYLGPVK